VLAGVSAAVPLVGSAPLHAPLAVHEVAFVDDHVSVVLPPSVMLVGLAVIVTAGELWSPCDPQASGIPQRIPTAMAGTMCSTKLQSIP
jgi:hypothetical protein